VKRAGRSIRIAAISSAILPALAGCGSPSAANIELRKQIQDLQSQIVELQRKDAADQASIHTYQEHATTVPSLDQDELNQLFTTASVQFGRLSGGYRPDPNLPGDTMLKIYAVPIDEAGDPIKAAGSFHVELFDLALKTETRIGQWDFDPPTTRSRWFGQGLLYTYVLDCPWQTPPVHAKLLARVSFTDALTHRVFTFDRDMTVQPPATK
jgi:outer membrane murein-binding lipoprotein Lpp